jgi:hypothetical protein
MTRNRPLVNVLIVECSFTFHPHSFWFSTKKHGMRKYGVVTRDNSFRVINKNITVHNNTCIYISRRRWKKKQSCKTNQDTEVSDIHIKLKNTTEFTSNQDKAVGKEN